MYTKVKYLSNGDIVQIPHGNLVRPYLYRSSTHDFVSLQRPNNPPKVFSDDDWVRVFEVTGFGESYSITPIFHQLDSLNDGTKFKHLGTVYKLLRNEEFKAICIDVETNEEYHIKNHLAVEMYYEIKDEKE